MRPKHKFRGLLWLAWNKKPLVAMLCSLIIGLAFRLLLPYGDEPDFQYRLEELKYSKDYFPFNFLGGLYRMFDYSSVDLVSAGPSSISQSIVAGRGADAQEGVIVRLILYFLYVSPLWVISVFHKETKVSLALALTLIFPSSFYYFGLLSHESLFSVISILYLLLPKMLLVRIACMSYLFLMDPGNSVVFCYFLCMSRFFQYLSLKAVYVAVIVIFVGSYFFQAGVLPIVAGLGVPVVSEIALRMTDDLVAGDFFDKYPVMLRPLITYMSAVLFTPAYIKAIPAYLVCAYGIYCIGRRLANIDKACVGGSSTMTCSLFRDCLAVFMVAISIVFMFPSYANFKYYVFSLYLFMRLSIEFYRFETIFLFNFGLSLLVLFSLALAYL